MMHIRKLASILVVFAISCIPALGEDADEWYKKGKNYYEQESYELALMCFDKALGEKSSNKDLYWYWKGKTLYNLEMYTESINCFDKSLNIDPEYEWSWIWRGYVLHKLELYEDAIEAYDNAIQIDPLCKEAWRRKGAVLYELGLYEDSRNAYDKAIQIDPLLKEAWRGKGWALYGLDSYESALDAFDNAIQVDSLYKDAWSGKGRVLYKLGSYSESLQSFDKAINIDSEYAAALSGKGLVLCELGRCSESIALCDRAIELNPESKWIYKDKGDVLYKLERCSEAVQYYDKSLELDPSFDEALYGRSLALSCSLYESESNETFAKVEEPGYREQDHLPLMAVSFATEIPQTSSALPPQPLFPPNGYSLMDNGCEGHTDFVDWTFAWSPIDDATMYNLYVTGENAIYPLIDVETEVATYRDSRIGYIVDRNRFNWSWKVRAYVNGQWSDYSSAYYFDVEPLDTDCNSAAIA